MMDKFVELAKELAVQGQMLDVLLKLQFALNGDTANVLHINREVPNVDQDLIQFRAQKRRKIQLKDKCVELVKELAVQDQMLDVLLKLQFALNGDIASALHINQEILNVDQDLIPIKIQRRRMMDKFVELAKELAVQDRMLDVLLKLQFVLNGDIASVLHIDLETLNVDQASDYISISFVNCLFYNLDIITSVSIVKLN